MSRVPLRAIIARQMSDRTMTVAAIADELGADRRKVLDAIKQGLAPGFFVRVSERGVIPVQYRVARFGCTDVRQLSDDAQLALRKLADEPMTLAEIADLLDVPNQIATRVVHCLSEGWGGLVSYDKSSHTHQITWRGIAKLREIDEEAEYAAE